MEITPGTVMMIRFRLMAALGALGCVLQAGCLETVQRMVRSDTPYSPRTATSYDDGIFAPNPPQHPEVDDYMARLDVLRQGRQNLGAGVPMRPVQVPILPPGMAQDMAPTRRMGPLGPGATRRRVTIPGLMPPAAPTATPPPAQPAGTAPPPGPAVTSPQPRAAMPLDADAIGAFITAVQARAAADPNNLDLQLQLRLLLAAAGHDADALQPIGGLTAEENKRVGDLLQMIMALRDQPHVAPTPKEAEDRLAALEYFQEQLQAVADLQIPAIRLCSAVDGYGVYDAFESNTFVAGETHQMIVYCEVRNYSVETDETGMYRTTLNRQLALYNEAGELAQPVQINTDILDVSANRRHDFYLQGTYFLRGHLPPGEYTLKVTVEDPLANKAATESITITLTPPQ